jgi:hypothetical protein
LPGQKGRPYLKNDQRKKSWSQDSSGRERLPSKYKDLSSNSSTTSRKQQQKRNFSETIYNLDIKIKI